MRVKWKLLAAQLLTTLLITMSAPASAQQQPRSTLDVVKERGTLIAGVKSDYPPFGYIDEKGELVGFDIEIMKYLAKRLEVKADLRPVTSANRIPMLQNGTIDVIAASLTITQERVQAVDFTVPYIVIGSKFLVKKSSGIKSYEDLAGKTVAYTQGTPWGDKVAKEQPKAKTLVFQDKPQAVVSVLQGKADAYVDDAAPLFIFARQHPELEAVGEPTKPSPMGIAVRQNDAKWRNAINFALIAMWEDGTYAELHRKFFGIDPDPSFVIYTWKL
jgi:polar amino acid transport system substrate-binding protein